MNARCVPACEKRRGRRLEAVPEAGAEAEVVEVRNISEAGLLEGRQDDRPLRVDREVVGEVDVQPQTRAARETGSRAVLDLDPRAGESGAGDRVVEELAHVYVEDRDAAANHEIGLDSPERDDQLGVSREGVSRHAVETERR